mmetsp:Transcript_63643/g.164251  ORF Transcript_63643/g.164251 Transcript_63643/m.164251 type:complete len:204 (+) Transcript_63643:518-1129(+)
MSSRTSASGRVMGNMPFLKQLLKKMSAKLVEIKHRMPKSLIAHGACSREEPQPKLSPQTMILAWRYASRFSTNSGSSEPSILYRIGKKALLPRPVRLIVLRNCFGMIMSVSTFCMSKGATVPLSVVNLGMPPTTTAPATTATSLASSAEKAGAAATGADPTNSSQLFRISLLSSGRTNSRTSQSLPVIAAAAAMAGLTKCVRP